MDTTQKNKAKKKKRKEKKQNDLKPINILSFQFFCTHKLKQLNNP